MKRMILVAAAFLAGSLAFAAPAPGEDQGRGNGPEMGAPMGGPGLPPGVEWKIGTSVLVEYKKVTGQIQIGQRLVQTLKVDTTEYLLRLPRKNIDFLGDLKNGDTVTFEGLAETVKTAEGKVTYSFLPFKAVVNGKEIELARPGRGPDMMKGPDGGPEKHAN